MMPRDTQGHFTQPDPIVPGGGSYDYTAGDPVNRADPSGLYWGEGAVEAAGDAANSALKFTAEKIVPVVGACLAGGGGVAFLLGLTAGIAGGPVGGIGGAGIAFTLGCEAGLVAHGYGISIPSVPVRSN